MDELGLLEDARLDGLATYERDIGTGLADFGEARHDAVGVVNLPGKVGGIAPPIRAALHEAVDRGQIGYLSTAPLHAMADACAR